MLGLPFELVLCACWLQVQQARRWTGRREAARKLARQTNAQRQVNYSSTAARMQVLCRALFGSVRKEGNNNQNRKRRTPVVNGSCLDPTPHFVLAPREYIKTVCNSCNPLKKNPPTKMRRGDAHARNGKARNKRRGRRRRFPEKSSARERMGRDMAL